jgi:uncharacterized phage protein (TIGR01671 family)
MFTAEEMTKDQLAILPNGQFANIDGGNTSRSRIYTHDEILPLQFTGLVDRNGEEIYEGDIVKLIQTLDGNFVDQVVEPYEVVFQGVSFQYKPIKDRQFKQYTVSMIGCVVEVVGDIYQHPEILEAVK